MAEIMKRIRAALSNAQKGSVEVARKMKRIGQPTAKQMAVRLRGKGGGGG